MTHGLEICAITYNEDRWDVYWEGNKIGEIFKMHRATWPDGEPEETYFYDRTCLLEKYYKVQEINYYTTREDAADGLLDEVLEKI